MGALIGGLAGGLYYVSEPALGAGVAATLAIATLIAVTGALHEDGLADCADGLGVRANRERRLEVMRDSATGTFGALALVLYVVLAVSALADFDRETALRTLVVAAATGRWAALIHAITTPPARPYGLGARFTVSPAACAVASATTAAVAFAFAGVGRGVVAIGLAAVAALLLTAWSRASIGGRTGDTLGATVALTQVIVVVVVVLLGPAAR